MSATKKQYIVGIGEVLWDIFPDSQHLGGAPTNFACNFSYLNQLHQHPFSTAIISQVGDDKLGKLAIKEIHQANVDTQFISTCKLPTGQVDIQQDDKGNGHYLFLANTAWDHLAWHDSMLALVEQTAAVCFGSLAQRSAESKKFIHHFIQKLPDSTIKLFDINLRAPFDDPDIVHQSLEVANVVKINEDELLILQHQYQLSKEYDKALTQLRDKFSLDCVALTRGEKGAIILTKQSISELTTTPVISVNTVGAGDAYTAALTMGLLNKEPLDVINRNAMTLASNVCQQQAASLKLNNY